MIRTTYIALLRGMNVGGKNILKMADLRVACERRGFANVASYINSGNLIFDSERGERSVRETCERLLKADFNLEIPVCVMTAAEWLDTLAQAPSWWNQTPQARHDAFFVIPPLTAPQVCEHIGQIKEEYESLGHVGRVLFWSAPLASFSRTRVAKISRDKAIYAAITVRNAKTTLKLADLAKERNEQTNL